MSLINNFFFFHFIKSDIILHALVKLPLVHKYHHFMIHDFPNWRFLEHIPTPYSCKEHHWPLCTSPCIHPCCMSPFRKVFCHTGSFLLNSGLLNFLKIPHHEGLYCKPFRIPSSLHHPGVYFPPDDFFQEFLHNCGAGLHFLKAIVTLSMEVIVCSCTYSFFKIFSSLPWLLFICWI